jgi:hypothetical protein
MALPFTFYIIVASTSRKKYILSLMDIEDEHNITIDPKISVNVENRIK